MSIKKEYIYIFFLFLIGYFTFFKNYYNPPKQFWDENYHIASAQKYIDGVMFMEPHPPLGKLFIALGEVLLHPNDTIDKSSFDKTDYIKRFPKHLSYKGFRLFPTLFAWANVVLLFLILLNLTNLPFFSFLSSFLYLFDNAIIVHSRAAMLEGIQIFFILLNLLYFLKLYKKESCKKREYIYLGILFGLALSVKANSAILFLLLPILIYKEHLKDGFYIPVKIYLDISIKSFLYLFSAILVFIFIMYIHTTLGKKLPQHKTYSASKEYLHIIKEKKTSDIRYFPLMLRDNLIYMKNYQKGVPKLNLCKKGENGSLFIGWPLGIKSINYRWEKHGSFVKYLYLQINPLSWFLALFATFLSIVLVVSTIFFKTPTKDKKTFSYIVIFAILYISYMIAIGQIDRVMYLYHYFIPLIFSYILSALIFYYIFEDELKNNNRWVYGSLISLVLGIVYTYYFFSPLTYYRPLDAIAFHKRCWFDFWQLKNIR